MTYVNERLGPKNPKFAAAMKEAFDNRTEMTGSIPIMGVTEFVEEQMAASNEYWDGIHEDIEDFVLFVAYKLANHLVDTGQKELQDTITRLNEKNKALEGLVDTLEQENRQLWNKNGELVWLNESQRQSISDLVAANTSVAQQNTNNYDDLERLRDENRDILEENTYLRKDITRLTDLTDFYNQEDLRLRRDVSLLESNLDSCMDARKQLLDKIDRLEVDIRYYKQAIGNQFETINMLQSRL